MQPQQETNFINIRVGDPQGKLGKYIRIDNLYEFTFSLIRLKLQEYNLVRFYLLISQFKQPMAQNIINKAQFWLIKYYTAY